MDKNRILDDRLAEFTDALLRGREIEVPQELEQEAQMVRLLAKIIAPHKQVNPAFQQRLTRRLTDEWDHAQRRPSQRLLQLNRRTLQVAAAAAAAFTLVLAAILLGVLGEDAAPQEQTASAVGFDLLPVLILVMVGIIAAGAVYLWNRRK